MKNMKTLEQLKEQANKILRKISNLEEKERQEVAIPILKKSIGKCFKYINNYGSSYPTWPLYLKIVDFDEESCTFETVSFQITSTNKVEAEFRTVFNFNGKDYFKDSHYQEISASEYEKAKRHFLKKINSLFV